METTKLGEQLQAPSSWEPHGIEQVKALALVPSPAKPQVPFLSLSAPQLLRRSRAIDFPALPFKTLLAQRLVGIV